MVLSGNDTHAVPCAGKTKAKKESKKKGKKGKKGKKDEDGAKESDRGGSASSSDRAVEVSILFRYSVPVHLSLTYEEKARTRVFE